MIKQEDFDKLNQLDRIEFMMKYDQIERRYQHEPIIDNFVFFLILLNMSLLIICFLTKSSFGIIIFLFKILIFYICSMFIINIIHGFFKKKYKKELEEKFFNFETKPKKIGKRKK